ncbi:MAG: hypothetical protein OXN86_12165 [Chloroflexota bacterium]|nr:hypothetical protein [Chloroflexota bacterium]
MDLPAIVRQFLGRVVRLRLRTVLLIAVAPIAVLFVYAFGRSLDESLGYDLTGSGAVVLDTVIVCLPEHRLLILAGALFAYSFIGAAFWLAALTTYAAVSSLLTLRRRPTGATSKRPRSLGLLVIIVGIVVGALCAWQLAELTVWGGGEPSAFPPPGG